MEGLAFVAPTMRHDRVLKGSVTGVVQPIGHSAREQVPATPAVGSRSDASRVGHICAATIVATSIVVLRQSRRTRRRRAACCWSAASGGNKSRAAFMERRSAGATETAQTTVQLPVKVETKGVPVYFYAPLEEIEEQARAQLICLAESPLPVDHVAAMPDVHMGKGVAIGAVWASDKFICPNAVGVDIGCGMCAVPMEGLYKDELSIETMVDIQKRIKRTIPMSFDSHSSSLAWAKKTIDEISEEHPPTNYLRSRLGKEDRIAKQLGTLGGGNHFIELVYAEETNQVWCMLHSGSRNVGNTTAEYYDKLAGKRGHLLQGVAGSLNYLDVDSEDGQNYLKDMLWCQAYARENRRSMLQLMIGIVEEATGKKANMDKAVNTHHNFCQSELCKYQDPQTGEVMEKQLWVTRKGATSARDGQYGLIPGSMGVGSYVVRGKGSEGSWQSCSHGAGRTMSRSKAHKTINQADFEEAMKGIVCDTAEAVKDEAPQAYKDLNQVLRNQRDLVEIEHRLLPLINVKGYEDKVPSRYRRSGSSRGGRSRRKRAETSGASS
eukprot:TRINITY_DN30444_c0_g1_i3.p1 TRINITY_DN30444_c0_g1~~TRINITY_DN30444_c0_g1_i3.p1  ORF type:complete len:550 (-),score=123.08 TRINITY_DN30444_c0_g1_i3:178-1827(-)